MDRGNPNNLEFTQTRGRAFESDFVPYMHPGLVTYSAHAAPGLNGNQFPRPHASQQASAAGRSADHSSQQFFQHDSGAAAPIEHSRQPTRRHPRSTGSANGTGSHNKKPVEAHSQRNMARRSTPPRQKPQWNEDTTVPGTFEGFGSASRRPPAVQEVSPAARPSASKRRARTAVGGAQRARHPYARLLQLRRQGETPRERRKRLQRESLNNSTVSASNVNNSPPPRRTAAARTNNQARVVVQQRTSRPPRPPTSGATAQPTAQAPTPPPQVHRSRGGGQAPPPHVPQYEEYGLPASPMHLGVTGGDFMSSLHLDKPVNMPPRQDSVTGRQSFGKAHHPAKQQQAAAGQITPHVHRSPPKPVPADVVLQVGSRAHLVRSQHAHSGLAPGQESQQQGQQWPVAADFQQVQQRIGGLHTTQVRMQGQPSHPWDARQHVLSSARAGVISAPPGSALDGSRVEAGDVHDMQGYLPPPSPFMYAPSQQDSRTAGHLYAEMHAEPMWAQYDSHESQRDFRTAPAATFTANVPDLADHVWHHSMKQAAAQAATDEAHTTYAHLGLAAAGGGAAAAEAEREAAPHEALEAADAKAAQLQQGNLRGAPTRQLGERPKGSWSHGDKQRLAADDGRLAFFSSAERLSEAVRQSGDLRTMLASLQGAMEAEGGVAADLAERQAARAAAAEAGLGGLQRHDAHTALKRAGGAQPWDLEEGGGADAQSTDTSRGGAESKGGGDKPAGGLWRVNAGGALQGHLLLCAAQAAHRAGHMGATSGISAPPHVLQGDALGEARCTALRQHSLAVARQRRIKHAALNATWGKDMSGEAATAVTSLGDLVLVEAVTDRLWPAYLHATARRLDEGVEEQVQQVVNSV